MTGRAAAAAVKLTSMLLPSYCPCTAVLATLFCPRCKQPSRLPANATCTRASASAIVSSQCHTWQSQSPATGHLVQWCRRSSCTLSQGHNGQSRWRCCWQSSRLLGAIRCGAPSVLPPATLAAACSWCNPQKERYPWACNCCNQFPCVGKCGNAECSFVWHCVGWHLKTLTAWPS